MIKQYLLFLGGYQRHLILGHIGCLGLLSTCGSCNIGFTLAPGVRRRGPCWIWSMDWEANITSPQMRPERSFFELLDAER